MIVVVLALVAAAFGGGFLWAFMGWRTAAAALTSAQEKVALVEESWTTMGELLKAQAAQSAAATR